jgi:L-amino acid N-acyltransferase YncA
MEHLKCQEKRAMKFHLEPISPKDREAVIDIFNHYVENSFAAYPESKVPYEFFDVLLKMAEGYPTVVARDEDGRIMGFGMLRAHNPMPTFSHTAEVTYFIKPEYTGKGLGTSMLQHLIEKGKEANITSVLANISSLNEGSIAFHEKHGFKECGRFHGICTKRGRAFDVVWMQRML